jgi:hypothetical protein
LKRITAQLRFSTIVSGDGETGASVSGGAYGLDFGAVLAFTAALGGPVTLVAEVLSEVEAVLIRYLRQKATP